MSYRGPRCRHREVWHDDIRDERARQVKLWGDQSALPDGVNQSGDARRMLELRVAANLAMHDGTVTFRDILAEEVAEAFASTDDNELRRELVQVAAVAAQWIEAIDKRGER